MAAAGVDVDWSNASIGFGGGGATKGIQMPIRDLALGRDDNAIHRQGVRGIVLENDISVFKGALGFT